MKKVLLTTIMSLMMCMGVCAQDYGYYLFPQENEKVLENFIDDHRYQIDKRTAYESLFRKAKDKYFNKHVDIRDMQTYWEGSWYRATGKVVWIMTKEEVAQEFNTKLAQPLDKVLDKALANVGEGSRLALDQVMVVNYMDGDAFKDQLLDILMDKGYKVVAKEYLEKLYEEQQNQQSGIYNERTTVRENNFSAVGYYINAKVTETSLRVQVINVSTGEYEGNAMEKI